MRLIDADKIESILTYTEFKRGEKAPWLENEVEAYRHFLGIIQSEETAFDVDKIIEQFRGQVKENAEAKSMARFEWLAAIEMIQKELERGRLNE